MKNEKKSCQDTCICLFSFNNCISNYIYEQPNVKVILMSGKKSVFISIL